MISKYKIVRKNFLSFLSGWTMCMYILTRCIPAESSTSKISRVSSLHFGNNDLGPLLSLCSYLVRIYQMKVCDTLIWISNV
jgi:hypothetical protein